MNRYTTSISPMMPAISSVIGHILSPGHESGRVTRVFRPQLCQSLITLQSWPTIMRAIRVPQQNHLISLGVNRNYYRADDGTPCTLQGIVLRFAREGAGPVKCMNVSGVKFHNACDDARVWPGLYPRHRRLPGGILSS
jgi:hypothetical protein